MPVSCTVNEVPGLGSICGAMIAVLEPPFCWLKRLRSGKVWRIWAIDECRMTSALGQPRKVHASLPASGSYSADVEIHRPHVPLALTAIFAQRFPELGTMSRSANMHYMNYVAKERDDPNRRAVDETAGLASLLQGCRVQSAERRAADRRAM
jgi:hypothetical protein